MIKTIKKIKNNQQGFTLLELLVSLAIMTTLISVFLVDYKSGNRGTELSLVAQNVITDIRLAQNNTLGSVEYNGNIPLGGWGVYFHTGSGFNNNYIVFADVNGDGEYDPITEGNTSFGARKVDLPEKVVIDSIETGADGISDNVHISFLPPEPETIIFNKTTLNNSLDTTITIKENWNNKTKKVFINSFGLVELID